MSRMVRFLLMVVELTQSVILVVGIFGVGKKCPLHQIFSYRFMLAIWKSGRPSFYLT